MVVKKSTKSSVKPKTAKAVAKTTKAAVAKGGAKKSRQLTRGLRNATLFGGLAAIAFGLVAIFLPGITLEVLIWVFGIFIIAMGVIWLAQAFLHMKKDRLWWLGAAGGVLATAVGIYLLANNALAIGIFAVLLTVYIFAQAVIDLIIASYNDSTDKWAWLMIGLLGIVFGLVIILNPLTASLAFVWALGLYVLLHGMVAVIYAMKIRDRIK